MSKESAITVSQSRDIGSWVVSKCGAIAIIIIVAGCAIRLAYANSCYLNPDEAAHFDVANKDSWDASYKAAFDLAHPPLLILVLHAMLFLGHAEIWLRMPSIACGTAALWFAFAWMRNSLGPVPALGGLTFLTFSPAAISASTEIRQYGLLLFFTCSALYATARTLNEKSIGWSIVLGFCLLGAIFSHYTAVIIVISIDFYIMLYLVVERLPLRVLGSLAVAQLVMAATLGWLYFGHVRGNISFGVGSSMDYLRKYYFQRGLESPVHFLGREILGTFSYLVGARTLSYGYGVAFLLGIAALWTTRDILKRRIALFVLTPFVVGIVFAAFQIFPFAGTRHEAYLLPFLSAGVGGLFLWLERGAPLVLLALGTGTGLIWQQCRAAPDNNPRVMKWTDMAAAIRCLHEDAPVGSVIVVDYETFAVLRYYLAADTRTLHWMRTAAKIEANLGGYRVVAPKPYVWAFDSEAIIQISHRAEALGLSSADPFWIVSVAWGQPSLASRLLPSVYSDYEDFGCISLIKGLPAK